MVTTQNRLAKETSPYLRQHAENPVDWYPWGEDAFAAARQRDVPILLSAMGPKGLEIARERHVAAGADDVVDGIGVVDAVGEDNVLFETDFPHPTCLYPAPLDTIEEKMLTLRPQTRRNILGENAAKLYRL